MEQAPEPEVVSTSSSESQAPEDESKLQGPPVSGHTIPPCNGTEDALKPVKIEEEWQAIPTSAKRTAITDHGSTGGIPCKKARMDEPTGQAVDTNMMTDTIGDNQQVGPQQPAEIPSVDKRTQNASKAARSDECYDTTMPEPDDSNGKGQDSNRENFNEGNLAPKTPEVVIKQEDDAHMAGAPEDGNKQPPRKKITIKFTKKSSPVEPLVSTNETNMTETGDDSQPKTAFPGDFMKEHLDIEPMEVDALNNRQHGDVQQSGSTGHEKPTGTVREAPNIMSLRDMPCEVFHAENQQVESAQQNLTEALPNEKTARSSTSNDIQRKTDKKQIVTNESFNFKASKRSKQLSGFRNAAHPSCTNEQKKRDEKEIIESLKWFGKMKSEDGNWLHPKLDIGLFTDQMIGVARMKELEKNGHGGILADQMGFGKTAQIIALVVSALAPKRKRKRRNKKKSKRDNDKKHDEEDDTDDSDSSDDADESVDAKTDIPYTGSKCTLIVGPPRSSKQLLDECVRFVREESGITSAPYSRKLAETFSAASFRKHEIIITAITEVVAEFRILLKLLRDRGLTLQDDWQKQLTLDRTRTPIPFLFATKFWRVVLDESHHIRNPRTLRAQGCQALQRVKSWCVSATPYVNSSWDLYSQMKFVGDPHAENRKAFKKAYHIVQEDNNLQSLEEKFKHLMIRRTSSNKRFGHPIVPKVTVHRFVIRISLSTSERAFLRSIKDRFKDMADKKGILHGLPLMRLLRLRQAISSPFMLESFIHRSFSKQEMKDMASSLREMNLEMDMLPNINRELNSKGGSPNAVKDKSLKATPRTDAGEIELLGLSVAFRENTCVKCNSHCTERRRLECYHVFCKACIIPEQRQENEEGLRLPCLICKKHYLLLRDEDDAMSETDPLAIDSQATLHGGEEDDDDKDKYWEKIAQDHVSMKPTNSKSQRGKKEKGKKAPESRPGYDYRSYRPLLDEHETRWLQEADRTKNLSLLGRGKIGPCAQQVQKITQQHPDDKIIVFTQFTQEAAMIGRLLQNLNITFVYINGQMSRKQTDDTLQAMAENPEITVMVTALKCGGESLNCQFANHVILVNPYFNNALEEQAIGRVARLGQLKEVYVYRIIADGTADDEVSRIQERKREEAAQLIGEARVQYFELTSDELNTALQ